MVQFIFGLFIGLFYRGIDARQRPALRRNLPEVPRRHRLRNRGERLARLRLMRRNGQGSFEMTTLEIVLVIIGGIVVFIGLIVALFFWFCASMEKDLEGY